MTNKIIVRADDLGYSEAVNLGINKTVREGIIKNVGFMVNMPTSESGLKLISNSGVDIGLHTVICSGNPVSDARKLSSITNIDGTFKSSKVYRAAKNDFVNFDEVIVEIEAQYQRFVDLVGRKPDYFEGHAVMSKNFVKGLQFVAKRHHAPFLNFSFDGTPVLFKNKKLYAEMDSMRPNYNPFETLKRAASAHHNDGYEMMVCHPGYLDNFILTHSSLTIPRTQEVDMLCDPNTKKWLKKYNVELIKYSEV